MYSFYANAQDKLVISCLPSFRIGSFASIITIMKRNSASLLRYFAKNISVVIGIVFIWRGIWYVLDFIDLQIFGGQHIVTSLGGIVIGLLIIYLPDKDLKEIEKL